MSIFKYYNENTGQWEPMTVASEIKKATESNLGGVKAKNAVSGDTQEVHIDNNGFLVTKPGGEGSLATYEKAGIVKVDGPVTANPTFDITPIKIDSNGQIFTSAPKASATNSVTPDKYRDYVAENGEGAIISQVCDNKTEGTGLPGLKCFVFTFASELSRKVRQIAVNTETTQMVSRVEETGTTWGPWVEGGGGGTGAVSSVNGRTGAVTLDASDVGAIPETSGVDGQYAVSNGAGGIRFISGGSGTNNIFVVNFVVSGENITSDKTSTEVIDAYNQKKICVGMLKDGGFNRMLTLTEIDTRYNSVFFGVINYDGDSLYSNYIYLIENEAVRYTPSLVTSVSSGIRGQFAISNGSGGLDFITLQNAAEVAL